jgi:proline dehydrogenase
MLGSASKAFFHLLAQSRTLQKLATRFAMRSPASFVHRFVPGETVEDAIRAARALEAHGRTETFDYLGESVTTLDEAVAATRDYLNVITAVIEAGVERNVSLKLTQLGLDVDRAYARMMKVLITDGHYPAIATHDPAMIDLAQRWASEHGVASDRFEFQMLYGIRRDLQKMLVNAGYRVRIYVPFGRDWFPYFMRRLGEHPANVAFVLRGILEGR